MCGFNHTKGKYIVTIDDDLQIPPEEIPKLIEAQRSTCADIVYGIYAKKKHDRFRNVGSFLVQKIFKKIFNSGNNITSFRLITGQIVERLKTHKENFVYIDGLLHWYTDEFAFVEVNHRARAHGRSGYTFFKLLNLANNLLFNFTTLPLRWTIYTGFSFAVLSICLAFFFILRKMFYDVPIGFTSIIVTLFFIASLILLVIGVVGEYVSRLYSLQNDKPQYSIRHKL